MGWGFVIEKNDPKEIQKRSGCKTCCMYHRQQAAADPFLAIKQPVFAVDMGRTYPQNGLGTKEDSLIGQERRPKPTALHPDAITGPPTRRAESNQFLPAPQNSSHLTTPPSNLPSSTTSWPQPPPVFLPVNWPRAIPYCIQFMPTLFP